MEMRSYDANLGISVPISGWYQPIILALGALGGLATVADVAWKLYTKFWKTRIPKDEDEAHDTDIEKLMREITTLSCQLYERTKEADVALEVEYLLENTKLNRQRRSRLEEKITLLEIWQEEITRLQTRLNYHELDLRDIVDRCKAAVVDLNRTIEAHGSNRHGLYGKA
ncbi:hypothetical protein BGZ61DRAFT_74865 [Ilyonectria robusta]|uniref:uncharacterized protein n=1 Tax=Ilyonectria robusta TaxID=1079257 RepID=UPI001E8D67FB|nr:uncharacterized protein BGZ61DRAFT_74865 [Ilyonectria robusta]KAH8677117.1 hypothetical protein BGZ61DRAFT_74865 [Ilyonectria robusta]